MHPILIGEINMRLFLYLIAAFSSALLSVLFFFKENYFVAAIGVIVMFYNLYRMVIDEKKKKAKAIADVTSVPLDDTTRERIRQELMKQRDAYMRNRKTLIISCLAIIVGSAVIAAMNWYLGIAMSIFCLPLLFLIYKNTKAIILITKGFETKAAAPEKCKYR